MKRVLFVIATLEGGGAERVLSNIVTHFPDNWYIDILVNNESFIKYPYKGNILSLSLSKFKEKKSKIYSLREVVKRTAYLRKIKKENQYDVCISFLPSSNISNILSGNKYCKTIVSIHRKVFDEKPGIVNKISVFFFVKILYIHADKIITVSKEITQSLIRQLKISEEKVETIVNGYDGKWVRERMKIPPENKKINPALIKDQKIIITVGRMVEQKGQWHLIRAFSEVVKQEPDVRLWIVGEGVLKKYLTELVNMYGLSKQITFMGYSDNPFWYSGLADIFVLPSLFEGYPNVLVEALCCGVPCIAADVHSGAREILAPGLNIEGERINHVSEEEYGILIPVCSGQKYQHGEPLEPAEQKMAEAILMLLGNPEKRQHYREKSLKRSKDLDIKVMVDKWISVI